MSTNSAAEIGAETSVNEVDGLHRAIDWKGAFWIASGVPALVLISISTKTSRVGLRSLVWPPRYVTASSSHRCRSGGTGSPGLRFCRWGASSQRAMS